MAIFNEQAFEKLFTDRFGGLHAYAFSLLKDDNEAEEAVQAVFCRLWERRTSLPAANSPKAYLYGCVYHACVDRLRRRKLERVRRIENETVSVGAAAKVELVELQARFERVVAGLPDQCRHIYQLSRFGGLRYREIAEQLGISIKTVEAQMSKALKRLRKELADYL